MIIMKAVAYNFHYVSSKITTLIIIICTYLNICILILPIQPSLLTQHFIILINILYTYNLFIYLFDEIE